MVLPGIEIFCLYRFYSDSNSRHFEQNKKLVHKGVSCDTKWASILVTLGRTLSLCHNNWNFACKNWTVSVSTFIFFYTIWCHFLWRLLVAVSENYMLLGCSKASELTTEPSMGRKRNLFHFNFICFNCIWQKNVQKWGSVVSVCMFFFSSFFQISKVRCEPGKCLLQILVWAEVVVAVGRRNGSNLPFRLHQRHVVEHQK